MKAEKESQFKPVDAHFKACKLCGQRATLDAPEPIGHACVNRGVGDVLARISRAVGIEPCASCSSRQEWLNKFWPSASAPQQEIAASRLAVCGECDQLVGAKCTMAGVEVIPLAGGLLASAGQPTAEIDGACPARRWPGESRDLTRRVDLPPIDRPTRWLMRFDHGLGDHVQLTAVLAVLRRARPLLSIDLVVRAGCETLFHGLAEQVFTLGVNEPSEAVTGYHRRVGLEWRENAESFADLPSTKAVSCLRGVFGLDPQPAELRYYFRRDAFEEAAAAKFLIEHRAEGRAALLHYKGRCGPLLKNLTDHEAALAVEAIRAAGLVPFVLDWDGNTRLPGVVNAAEACPTASALAALARQAKLCIGIDSGPGKIFEAEAHYSEGLALIVWKRLHPINYSDLGDDVWHLVPWNAGTFIRGDRPPAEDYFARNYLSRVYRDLAAELPAVITDMIEALT